MKSKKKQSTASQTRYKVESLEDRRVLAVTYLESVAFEGDMSRSQEIELADFDGDGDLDAVALSGAGAVMFANNGDGTFASPVSVASLVGDGRSLEVADFDKDGDADFAIGSIGGDTLTWHRNDGSGNFSQAQALEQTETFGFVDALEVADIDGDGDFDILAVSRVLYGDSIYQIAKFENIDGAGTFGPAVTITADFKDPRAVHAVDMDGDGDLDLVGASSYISEDETVQEHRIFWFNNTDGQGNYSLVESITSGLEPRFMDSADFDGDGDLDLIIPQQGEDTIIMVENAGGAFGTVTILESEFTEPERVKATDFDNDGDADFLATNDNSGVVALYINDGTGDFTRTIVSDTTEQASGLDVADFDEDGDLDVFSTSQHAAAATLHENNGDGTFTDILLTGANAIVPQRAVMADIDGDGDQDFIGQSSWDLEIAWYENDGSGNYGAQTIIANSSLPPNTLLWFDIDAGDMDGDGDIDVITSEPSRDQIVWYENDGSGGTWTPHIEGEAGAGTLEIVLADMEGDGDLDVLTSHYFFGNVAWYVNDGTGSLTELNVGEFEAFRRIRVDAADIDGDGDQDVIAGSYMYYSSSVVTWFENVNGVFDEVQALWTPSNPVESGVSEIISADFDGDGDIDVATALFEQNGYDVVSWYENTDGAGTFAATSTFVTDEYFLHVNLYAVDMDGDGDLDLLTEGYAGKHSVVC
ncbi:MAG: VCBS repeat-containing protein [Pirellulaceae bacterium]